MAMITSLIRKCTNVKHLLAKILIILMFLFMCSVNNGQLSYAQLSAEQTVEISDDQDSDNKADRGDRLRYNVEITNQGGSDALDVLFEELLDVNSTFVPGSVQISPLAYPDLYETIGNVDLTVDVLNGLLVNDRDVDDSGVNPPYNDNLTLVSVDTTTNLGGTVTINDVSGAFTYSPPVGVSNATDTFNYVIQDADGSKATGNVSIAIGDVVWFVNNTSGGGDGRMSNPFNTLAEAETASAAGDIIFIYYGDGTTTGMNAGITLKDNQKLIGHGVDLVVNGQVLVSANTNPQIGNTVGDVITLANNNTVQGITLLPTASVGIAASGVSDATFDNISINKSNGTSGGIALSNPDGLFVFTNSQITGNSTGSAFAVNGGNADISYTGTITNSAGRSIQIQNCTGGSITFDSGTISDTGSGILIENNAGSSQFTFNSSLTLNTNTNTALNLNSNNGATINFSGGLDIDTTSGGGLMAIGGGNLNITGLNNSINTTSGTAINFDTLTLNTAFSSVVSTSTAANNGISIANTSGTLTIASGSITRTQAGSRVVNFAGNNTGTYDLSAITLNGNGSDGILLASGQNGTFSFGDLDVNNPSGGTGVTVNNNSADITFKSIDQNGGLTGVSLSATTGSFTITGDGTSSQNASGGNFQSLSSDAISLSNVSDIELNQLSVSTIGGQGILGNQVNNLNINNSTFNTIGDANDEHCFNFLASNGSGEAGITGTLLLDNVDVTNFTEYGLGIYNESGTVTISVINGSDFDDNHDIHGIDAIFVQTGGTANAALTVDGSIFNNIEGDIVYFVAGSTGNNDVNILNSQSTNGGGPDNFPNGGGIALVATNKSTMTFDVQGNDIRDLPGDPLILSGAAGGGNMEGRVGGPNINDGNTFSGSALGDGVTISFDGFNLSDNFTWTILVENNFIGQDNINNSFNGLGDDGIQILHRDNGGTLNLTIENNTIANTGSEGIRFFSDEDLNIGANNPTSNVRIANNSFVNIAGGEQAIELRTSDTAQACFHVTGNNGGASNSPGIIHLNQAGTSVLNITQASLAELSTANNSADATSSGTITFNGACTNPSLPSN